MMGAEVEALEATLAVVASAVEGLVGSAAILAGAVAGHANKVNIKMIEEKAEAKATTKKRGSLGGGSRKAIAKEHEDEDPSEENTAATVTATAKERGWLGLGSRKAIAEDRDGEDEVSGRRNRKRPGHRQPQPRWSTRTPSSFSGGQ